MEDRQTELEGNGFLESKEEVKKIARIEDYEWGGDVQEKLENIHAPWGLKAELIAQGYFRQSEHLWGQAERYTKKRSVSPRVNADIAAEKYRSLGDDALTHSIEFDHLSKRLKGEPVRVEESGPIYLSFPSHDEMKQAFGSGFNKDRGSFDRERKAAQAKIPQKTLVHAK